MPAPAPTTLVRELDARLQLSDSLEVMFRVQLRYDTADPYAVTVTFCLGDGGETAWVFARELLAAGMRQRTGEGDVVLRPSAGRSGVDVELLLSVAGRQALVTFPGGAMAGFVRATNVLVPPGTESEHLELDALIVQLLSSRDEGATAYDEQ